MRHPSSYQETKIYQRLKASDNSEAISLVDKMVEKIEPLLGLVGKEAFDNFTLHNAQHSLNLMGYADEIIPNETLDRLSCIELLIIIYSFYIHDIGMVVSFKDCEQLYASNAFKAFLESHSEYKDKILEIEEQRERGNIQPELEFYKKNIYQACLTDYLRPKHADIDRYNDVLKPIIKENPTLFQYKGNSFLEELLKVCHSHNCPAISLSEKEDGIKKFDPEGFYSDEKLNLQFCAGVLRICDILDFDKERTPSIMYSALGIEDKNMPGCKFSISEWQKQKSVHKIDITKDCIKVSANCKNPNIEHALRILCNDVERELRATSQELLDNKEEIVKQYGLILPQVVIPKIHSENYIYKDYSFKLDDKAIINLLMGDNLYKSPAVAARELLQNSIDACNARRCFDENYSPEINVSFRHDNDCTWLVVRDNGIGMDEYVLSNYFLKVGKSYYSSSEYKSKIINNEHNQFEPISRFGIGILSVFMIGDAVIVKTRNRFSNYNDDGRIMYLDNIGQLAIVQKDNNIEQGSIIEVKLKKDFATDEYITKIVGEIKDTFIRPAVTITIDDGKQIFNVTNKGFLKIKEGVEESLKASKIHLVRINFSEHSKVLSGHAYFFFYETEEGKWSYYDPSNKLIWGLNSLKNDKLFENLNAINIATLNGIRINVSKIGNMFNYKKKKMSYVMDINIAATEDITFDVSRNKIIGKGLAFVRKHLLRIIQKEFRDRGVMKLVTEETKHQLQRAVFRYEEREKLDEKLLKDVEDICPPGIFVVTKNLTNDISKKFNQEPDVIRGCLFAILNNRKSKRN